ncbi:MAG: MarR family transcriptional regulator [Erysipelotrichaceae bacterium]|nr:MarR family transcriptional regulator [Erysipelotrichaceae bacterium]
MKKINEELMKEFILASRFISRPHGRPMGQERILRKLADGPISQKALQEELFVRPGSISEIVSKLEEKGLLVRNKDSEDARSVNLELTEKGRERLNALEEEADLYSSISDEEKETLKEILTRLNNDWIRRGPIHHTGNRPFPGPGFKGHEAFPGRPHEFPHPGKRPFGREYGAPEERREHEDFAARKIDFRHDDPEDKK